MGAAAVGGADRCPVPAMSPPREHEVSVVWISTRTAMGRLTLFAYHYGFAPLMSSVVTPLPVCRIRTVTSFSDPMVTSCTTLDVLKSRRT